MTSDVMYSLYIMTSDVMYSLYMPGVAGNSPLCDQMDTQGVQLAVQLIVNGLFCSSGFFLALDMVVIRSMQTCVTENAGRQGFIHWYDNS
jgi:hypothetical protein